MALIILTAMEQAMKDAEAQAKVDAAKAMVVQNTMDLTLAGLREAEMQLHWLEAEVIVDTPEKKALVHLAVEAVNFAKVALAQLAVLKPSTDLKYL